MLIHIEKTIKKEGSHFVVLQWDKCRYKKACKVSWKITVVFNDPLVICILSQKGSKDTTIVTGSGCPVRVGASLVQNVPGGVIAPIGRVIVLTKASSMTCK